LKFELHKLPFEMDALEPYISRNTLQIHHSKYHQVYITNLNNLICGTKYKNLDLESIIKIADGQVFNNAAQAWNHEFYFEGLKPGSNNSSIGSFSSVIENSFGSVTFFKNTFTKAAVSLFGSGWVWLVLNSQGTMEIVQESKAGNPMRYGLKPLLSCDLWEHAYFLDYNNRRSDYLKAFWKLVNWEVVEKRYNEAL
jgi:superoxide dismutase, Fe-Mn family